MPNYGLSLKIAVDFGVTLSAANQNRGLRHPKAARSVDYGAFGDVILDSDWLPTTLRQNRQQCIKIDHSSAMY